MATYKLKEPVAFGDRRIPCIELPAPKHGSPYPAGRSLLFTARALRWVGGGLGRQGALTGAGVGCRAGAHRAGHQGEFRVLHRAKRPSFVRYQGRAPTLNASALAPRPHPPSPLLAVTVAWRGCLLAHLLAGDGQGYQPRHPAVHSARLLRQVPPHAPRRSGRDGEGNGCRRRFVQALALALALALPSLNLVGFFL